MPTVAKMTLSQSTDGRGIKLLSTNQFEQTLLHIGPTDPAVYDEIWLYCVQPTTSNAQILVQWGGETDPDDSISAYLRGENGLYEVLSGLVLKGNATAKRVRARYDFDPGSERGVFFGYVNRISP